MITEETEIIEKIVERTNRLCETIKEAENLNLEVKVDLPNDFALIKPRLKVSKVLY
jgi:hypothetical protein